MLFVTLTFVIGANVKELVCEPYQNMELFQVNAVCVTIRAELEPKLWFSSRAMQKNMSSLVFIQKVEISSIY